jgi:hypothetical protein
VRLVALENETLTSVVKFPVPSSALVACHDTCKVA